MKLLKSTAVVSLMTLISRILGLLRDILFAKYFGASGGTDAFFVAFKIPNFMRRLFAEGAFSQAFVPVFSEYRERRIIRVKKILELLKGLGIDGPVLFPVPEDLPDPLDPSVPLGLPAPRVPSRRHRRYKIGRAHV